MPDPFYMYIVVGIETLFMLLAIYHRAWHELSYLAMITAGILIRSDLCPDEYHWIAVPLWLIPLGLLALDIYEGSD